MAEFDNNNGQPADIFAKSVRAGKRTYFFDVRATRNNDYYLTITESKRKFTEGNDRPFFEKHKIFLYKEDFEKFSDGLQEAIEYIKSNIPTTEHTSDYQTDNKPTSNTEPPPTGSEFTDLNFDDLGKE